MAHFETFGNLGSGSGWVKDVDSNSNVKITRMNINSTILGNTFVEAKMFVDLLVRKLR